MMPYAGATFGSSLSDQTTQVEAFTCNDNGAPSRTRTDTVRILSPMMGVRGHSGVFAIVPSTCEYSPGAFATVRSCVTPVVTLS